MICYLLEWFPVSSSAFHCSHLAPGVVVLLLLRKKIWKHRKFVAKALLVSFPVALIARTFPLPLWTGYLLTSAIMLILPRTRITNPYLPGFLQGLSILPGISRLGVTMAAIGEGKDGYELSYAIGAFPMIIHGLLNPPTIFEFCLAVPLCVFGFFLGRLIAEKLGRIYFLVFGFLCLSISLALL